MAKLAIKKASTDVTVYLFIQASNVTTGAGLTGLTFETASLVASYVRPGAARAAITLATLAAADSAHSDGGFKEVDATNMPGIYRLDLPDAVCATGVNSVVVMLKGAANMAPVVLEIQLVSYDPNDAVRLGITALPNAAADAAGGLPISDAGGLDLDAQIKTDIDDLITRLTAARAGYLDKLNVSGILAHSDAAATYKADISALALEATLTAIKGAGWSDQTLVAIDILIDAIKAKTDLIPAAPAEVGSAMTLTAAYDKAKDDVLTPLATVDGIVDAIKAKTDNIPVSPAQAGEYTSALSAIQSDLDNPDQYKADVSGLATTLHLQEVEDKLDTADTVVDAIKAKTDNLPAYPADDSDIDSQLAAIKTIIDDLHNTDLPAVKTETAAILEDTGTTLHNRLILVEQILRNKMITDPATGVMTLYDDAGNVLLTANIFQDAAGTQAYQGQGAERRERLS